MQINKGELWRVFGRRTARGVCSVLAQKRGFASDNKVIYFVNAIIILHNSEYTLLF